MVAFEENGQGYFTFEEVQKELDRVEKKIGIVMDEIKKIGEFYGLYSSEMNRKNYDRYLNIVQPLQEYRNQLIKEHQSLILIMGSLI